jgi:hypothetical protein
VLSRLGGFVGGAPWVSVSDLLAMPGQLPIDLKDSENEVAGLLHPADEHCRAPFRSPVCSVVRQVVVAS